MSDKPIPERWKTSAHRWWRRVAEELYEAEAACVDQRISMTHLVKQQYDRAVKAEAKIADLIEERDWLARQYQKLTGSAYVPGKVLPVDYSVTR